MKDEIVVVTGAGSGIGRATAILAAQRGARVAACDVDQTRLDSLATELADRAHVIRKVDVSDRAQFAAFAAAIDTVDVLVNNAGVGLGGSFVDTSLDDWDWVLGINLRGVVHGCHFFAPKMIARRAGHIVNVSSIFGIYAAPSSSAYVASKFAVRGLSLSLRQELAPHGVGVTAICPGMIATSIIEDGRIAGDPGDRKQRAAKVFRERGARPEKVAAAILDAARTNPAVRTVGTDARLIASLARVAPRALEALGARFQRRFG
ncbi:MAG TPA: SDR family NAD(P)-dependent oxidoreductase [Kofleriaceae bacterium]|nr:SDR family NAD(P)-dependent oxidoreductase [Kofleriaceae bacterium]